MNEKTLAHPNFSCQMTYFVMSVALVTLGMELSLLQFVIGTLFLSQKYIMGAH